MPAEVASTPANAAADAESLRQFLASGIPAPQEFVLRPGRDTVLRGAQGTQVRVPANAWAVAPGSGLVKLTLREFYTPADMILSGLVTTSNGRPLETGGMLQLKAASQAGQPVHLRPGAALKLRLPAAEAQPDMQLFYGAMGEQGLDWRLATTSSEQAFVFESTYFQSGVHGHQDSSSLVPALGSKLAITSTYSYKWPVYKDGEEQLRRSLQALAYPAATREKLLRAAPLTAREKALVLGYNLVADEEKRPHVRRMTEVALQVDSTGALAEARIQPGCDAELAAPLLAVAQSWQRWFPARRLVPVVNKTARMPGGRAAAVGAVWVGLTNDGQVVVGQPMWDEKLTQQLPQNAAVEKRAEAQALAFAGYNELLTEQLGWINCDRFIDARTPLFAWELPTLPGEDAQVSLLLRGIRGLLPGSVDAASGKVSFGQVPYQARGTVVAIRWQGGQAQLALAPVQLNRQPGALTLDYRPVSMTQLRTALAGLQ